MLSKRQEKILKAVIQTHIKTASPVSSKSICKNYQFGVSPATIRNEMQTLEEMGYLHQPHTSAGRIPTELGYKLYIENLMDTRELTGNEKKIIIKEFSKNDKGLNEIMKNASYFLSDFAKNVGIVIAPRLFNTPVVKIELIKLSEQRILAILILKEGISVDRVLFIKETIKQRELERVSAKINELLYGKTLAEIRGYYLEEVINELIRFDRFMRKLKKTLYEFFKLVEEKIIYLEGVSNIAAQPEFSTAENIKHILYIIDDKQFLNKVLDNAKNSSEKVSIIMSGDIEEETIKGCSLVIAPYGFHNFKVGNIGVLGPLRMDYSKVVSLVGFISENLTKYLNRTI